MKVRPLELDSTHLEVCDNNIRSVALHISYAKLVLCD